MRMRNKIAGRLFLFLFLMVFATFGYSQEDCANGIDDDGDGLVDLNDIDDCICGFISYETIEGDFEDYDCCPSQYTAYNGSNDGLDCLSPPWRSVHQETPDYFNTCDFTGGYIVPEVPLPIPSGNGAIGFLDAGHWSEYIGLCLDDYTLIQGEEYSLSFYAGFNTGGPFGTWSGDDWQSDLDFEICIYGTTNCLWFPLGDDTGCITATVNQEYELIACIPVSGIENNSWVFVEDSFTSTMNAKAIAFGYSCQYDNGEQYHFIDDIRVEGDFMEFQQTEEIVQTGDCIDGIALEVDLNPVATYQWYLNGEAIIGATSNIYSVDPDQLEGWYTVMTTTAEGCLLAPLLYVLIDRDILEIEGEITDLLCEDFETGGVAISTNSNNTPLSVLWSNGSNTLDLTNIGAGTYSVTITDDNGCEGIVDFEIELPENLEASYTGGCLEGLFISVEDDILGASYQWFLNGVLVPDAITNPYQVPSGMLGSYHVEVDNGIRCAESNPLLVDMDLEVLEIEGEVVDLKCYLLSNGGIDIEVNSGNLPHSYQWSNGEIMEDIMNLTEGIYEVTVTDAYGCFGIIDFVVSSPDPFINTLTVIQPDMGNPGSASIISTGGVLPYSYAWNNGFDESSNENLSAGTYTITVTDGNGCIEVFEFEITGNYTVSVLTSDVSCPTECNGSIIITVDGPDMAYTIIWEDIELFGFNPIGLCAGTYEFTVLDIVNSAYSGSVSINSPLEIGISAIYKDSICNSSFDQNISLSVTGGNPPYTYLWNTGSFNDTLFNAVPGTYSVAVVDSVGCIAIDTFIINSLPAIDLQFNPTPTGCDGEENGSIELMVNGAEPFKFIWSNDVNTKDQSDLGMGWYLVTVTDGNGCTAIDSIYIDTNTGFEINAIIIPANCKNDNNGSISLEVIGGQTPYNILWSNNENTSSIENLEPGSYGVTVEDNLGCLRFDNFEILLNSDFSILAEIKDNECFDGVLGSIELMTSNINSPYNIMWEDGSIEENRYNLMAGHYEYILTDNFGCEHMDSFLISEGSEITYLSIISEPDCNGASNGYISISSLSGASPFAFQWSNGQTLSQIKDLLAGSYFLSITDEKGCVKLDTFILAENTNIEVAEIIIDNACFGQNSGSIHLDIDGGSEPYTIIWSNGENTSTINALQSDDYFVTIEDAIGCIANLMYTVLEPDSFHISSNITLPLCFDDVGSISVQGQGGIGPYEYQWSSGESTGSIVIYPGNSYSILVSDVNGCSRTMEFVIDNILELEIAAISILNPGISNNDGSITVEVAGGAAPYIITWDNNQMGTIATNLSTGIYTATAVDINGCAATITIELSNDPLTLTEMVTDNLCFGTCEGEIILTLEGGASPYSITWSDGQTGLMASLLCNGEYQATVIDGEGVQIVTDVFEIISPTAIIIDGQAYDISCINADDGSVLINSEGGEGPFEYNWSNSNNGKEINGLNPGDYVVTVVDINGCSESELYTIENIPLLDLIIETIPVHCDNSNGTILIIGENPYNYPYFLNGEAIIPNEKNEIVDLIPGSYDLAYSINPNCIISLETVIINNKSEPEFIFELSGTEFFVSGKTEILISLDLEEDSLITGFTVEWLMLNPFECTTNHINGQCTGVSITTVKSETIQVVINDLYGCQTILEAKINVQENKTEFYIPNVFSPNNDGINDKFEIYSNSADVYVKSMQIYDRWGNLVYMQKNVEFKNLTPWDGFFNGATLNSGVFVYMIQVITGDGELIQLIGDTALIY